MKTNSPAARNCSRSAVMVSASRKRKSERPWKPTRPQSQNSSPGRATSNAARRHTRPPSRTSRSEEHTSELQSHSDIVCRLLLEKKKLFLHLEVKPLMTLTTVIYLSCAL